MSLSLSKTGIEISQSIEAWHVSQTIDALTGQEAYDISISGSFTIQNGTEGTNKIAITDSNGTITFTNSITASLQGTSSYASNALSSSYARTASYVQTAQTASYVLNAITASYVQTASYAQTAQTASYVETAQTASYVLNGVSGSGTDSYLTIWNGTKGLTYTSSLYSKDNRLYIGTTTDPNNIGGIYPDLYVNGHSMVRYDGNDSIPTFRIQNTKDGSSRFIDYVQQISGSTVMSANVINNGGYNSNNAMFHLFHTNCIQERTTSTGGTRSDIEYTKGFRWMSFNGGGYEHYMSLFVSGASEGNLYLGDNQSVEPTYLLQLGADSAAKPSTNTWTISSDERLKENIEEANYDICYNVVKNLPLKRYTWKKEAYTDKQVNDRTKLGWIAQEVEQVFPKAVKTSPFTGNNDLYIEDCKTLNADQIYATLYGAVKKLIQENESLKNRIEQLENK